MQTFLLFQAQVKLKKKCEEIERYRMFILSERLHPEDYLSASQENSKANQLYAEADKIIDIITRIKKNEEVNKEESLYILENKRPVMYQGVRYESVSQLAKKLNISPDVLNHRIRAGYPETMYDYPVSKR